MLWVGKCWFLKTPLILQLYTARGLSCQADPVVRLRFKSGNILSLDLMQLMSSICFMYYHVSFVQIETRHLGKITSWQLGPAVITVQVTNALGAVTKHALSRVYRRKKVVIAVCADPLCSAFPCTTAVALLLQPHLTLFSLLNPASPILLYKWNQIPRDDFSVRCRQPALLKLWHLGNSYCASGGNIVAYQTTLFSLTSARHSIAKLQYISNNSNNTAIAFYHYSEDLGGLYKVVMILLTL